GTFPRSTPLLEKREGGPAFLEIRPILVECPQFVFEVEVKRGHGRAEPLALAGLVGGTKEALEGEDVLPQAAVAFHARLPPLLSQPPTSLPISSRALATKLSLWILRHCRSLATRIWKRRISSTKLAFSSKPCRWRVYFA